MCRVSAEFTDIIKQLMAMNFELVVKQEQHALCEVFFLIFLFLYVFSIVLMIKPCC